MYENAGRNKATLFAWDVRYIITEIPIESNFNKIFKFRLRPLNLQNHLVKPDANNWFSS